MLALGRAATGNNEVRCQHNADYVHDHDDHNGVERKFAGGFAPDDREGGLRQLLMHHAEAISPSIAGTAEFFYHRIQAKRDKQNRKQDNAHALNEIGPVCGRDATEHAVERDDDRHQRHEHIFGFHPEQFLAHERHGHLANGGKQHRTVHHVIKAAEDGVRHADGLGFITFHKPITQSKAAHAAIPHGGDPVDRRDKEPVHHTPHAAHAVGKGAAGGVHRIG